eukprot:2225484-Amphidinium_carterae.1
MSKASCNETHSRAHTHLSAEAAPCTSSPSHQQALIATVSQTFGLDTQALMIYHGTAYDLPPRLLMTYHGIAYDLPPRLLMTYHGTTYDLPRQLMIYLLAL